LDPVVDHLHEVPRPVRSAVEIAHRGAAALLTRLTAWRSSAGARCGRHPTSRRKRREDRLERGYHVGLAADHQAIPLLEPEHAATRSNIDTMNTERPQLLGAADIVVVVRVAAIDDDIA